MGEVNHDGLAVAREVSEFFECPFGDGEYQRLHLAHDSEGAPATAGTATAVVLTCGDSRVELPENQYRDMLSEHGLKPGEQHSALAALWLSQSASKRRLTELAQKLMALSKLGTGLVLVRRPDGSVYKPTPVTSIKVARAEEEEQHAVVADVEAFFDRGEG